MKTRIDSIRKSSFFKKIFLMFKGTVISQILGILGSLFLAKLYAPELYGFYSVFLSILSIVSVLNSLKLEYIIVTEKSEKQTINITNTLLVVIFIVTIIHIILVSLTNNFFFERGIPYSILILAVITALFFSGTKVFESYATRISSFKTIAFAKVLTTSSTFFFQLFFFYAIKGYGLLYGYIASIVITFIYYYFTSKVKISAPNFHQFKKTVKTHKNILKFGFPSNLINTIALNIMPILMLSYFSTATAGIYSLSLKIVSIPLSIISASVAQVYFQKASKLFNYEKHKLYDLTKKIVFTNVIIMFIILVLINTVGIYFLTLFFNTDWVNLNQYTFILSFYILGQITFSPISSIIIVTNKMQLGLIFNVTLLIINFISIYIGNIYNDIMLTIKLLSFIGGFSYLFLLFYFLILLKSYKNEV